MDSRDIGSTTAPAQALAAAQATFIYSPVGMAKISIDARTLGQFLEVNDALADCLGYTRSAMRSMNVVDLTHPGDLPVVASMLTQLASGELDTTAFEHRFLHADGRPVWVQAATTAIVDDPGAPPYVVAVMADITARVTAQQALAHSATHDALTGLANRSAITAVVADALGAVAGTPGAGAVAVLLVDLDNFSDVNTSLGHEAGDELLVECARRLTGTLDDSETVARLGGDEFVIVSTDVRGLEGATLLAERISRALAIQLPLSGQMVTTSASIGIAQATGSERPEDLLRSADSAMHRAKANGRARYEFSDQHMQARALRQIQLEADLRATLEVQTGADARPAAPATRPAGLTDAPLRGRLFLDYQPCFDSRTGALVACEALLRWDHPTRGVLAPGQFLDVAEDRALMAPLGAWVLQEAAEQAATWYRQFGPGAPEMWVNISAAQLGRQLTTLVGRVLDTTGLPARLLCLELTERHALSSADGALDDLLALPGLGVRLAIDDFGTGYAGMDYLRKLPAAALKVDASYVAAIGQDPTGTALVASVVNLGHALDLTVIAEGVETDEQRQIVTELGADILQGYGLGRPTSAATIGALLLDTVNHPTFA